MAEILDSYKILEEIFYRLDSNGDNIKSLPPTAPGAKLDVELSFMEDYADYQSTTPNDESEPE